MGKNSRFEKKNESLANNKTFAWRLFRYSLFALVLLAFSAGIGTVGYHALANLSWIDSFHMACLILTGMGPVVEMQTNEAKLFSSFYALYSGVAFLSITAVFFAPLIHRMLHILHVDEDSVNP